MIEEGVLGRGGRIIASEICTILLIIHKPNSIIVYIIIFLSLGSFWYFYRPKRQISLPEVFCRKPNAER